MKRLIESAMPCRLWLNARTGGGYGRRGADMYVHRWAWGVVCTVGLRAG